MGLSFLCLATGTKGAEALVVLGWALAFWWFRNALRSMRGKTWKEWAAGWAYPDKGDRFLIALAFGLLMVRLILSLLPINNWDSLNHHLPLLVSRLQVGGWDPMVWVSTERRTPLYSILPKLWAVSLDPTGRALIVQHLLLGIALLVGMGEVMKRLWPNRWWLLPLLMIWSLSDIWRHLLSAGDEIWLVLGSMAFLSMYWSKELRTRSLILGSVVPLATIGVKATAVFFILPFGLAWLFILRHRPWTILSLLGLGSFLVALSLAPNLWNYSMAYPANRWSDLLAADSPKVLSGRDVKEQRLAFGLDDHRDNRPPGAKAFSSFIDNLSRLPSLALGPYLIWFLVGVLSLGAAVRSKIYGRDGLALVMALLAIFLSMLSWSFSPQAMFRYLLPAWWVFLLSIGILLEGMFPKRWLRVGMSLMLLFGLGLEGREITKSVLQPHAWKPTQHWLEKSQDGPLIAEWRELSQGRGRAFYIGALSILMVDSNQHWLAQLGNEVGWRNPDNLSDFLKRENIQWWVLSSQADRLDPLYRRLTESLVNSGQLRITKALTAGEIYRVSFSPD